MNGVVEMIGLGDLRDILGCNWQLLTVMKL